MATVQENRSVWDDTYDWSNAGDEWSAPWGSAHMQWCGSILPRISAFVPAATILEIAPGYGRWTSYLKELCQQLVIVDLSERCIDRCRERFVGSTNISYHVNDGTSLDMVADRSIDFIFSFDSLVHAEDSVLQAYTAQIANKLRSDGVAFLHHSNLGDYAQRIAIQNRLARLPPLFRSLQRWGICDNLSNQWRARSMTAAKMAKFAEQCALQCVSQELVTWESEFVLIDCLSTLVRQDSKWARPARVFRNPGFFAEAQRLREMSRLYEWVPQGSAGLQP